MNCTNCGNALRPGDQFCLKCGGPAPPSNMEPSGAPASPPPQPQPQSYPPQSTQAPPPQQTQGYPPQQPQARPPSDAQNQARTLYGLAMLVSLIGGIMLMVFDFGGWYNYDGYLGVREWGWVGPYVNTYSILPFLAVAGSLFYCSFIAYQGFSSKQLLPRSLIMRGLVISIIVLVVVGVGAVALFAMTAEADSTWLEAGFYGGAIGSLLTALMFGLVLKNTPHTKVDKRGRYGAQPVGTQYPYPQTQAPQATEPLQQPQPETSREPQVTGPDEGKEEQPTQEEERTPKEEPQPKTQKSAQEPQPVQQQYQQQPQQQQYPQQYQQPYYLKYKQQPQQQTYPCRTCGRPLRYVHEYRRWYCDTCRQYV